MAQRKKKSQNNGDCSKSFRGFNFIYLDYVLSFNDVRRTTNKLVDILENQGVLSTKSAVVLSWPEIPLYTLKMQ